MDRIKLHWSYITSIKKKQIHISYYKSPYGELILGSFNEQLCLCDWKHRKSRTSVDKRLCSFLDAEYKEGSSKVMTNTKKQLAEYFESKRTEFDIPLLLAGSAFQQGVWNALLDIPYGTTTTYKKLSIKLANELAIRAIASANGANAISILVPCHRVIGTNGKLVGYAGGISAKRRLLQLEGSHAQLTLF